MSKISAPPVSHTIASTGDMKLQQFKQAAQSALGEQTGRTAFGSDMAADIFNIGDVDQNGSLSAAEFSDLKGRPLYDYAKSFDAQGWGKQSSIELHEALGFSTTTAVAYSAGAAISYGVGQIGPSISHAANRAVVHAKMAVIALLGGISR